jgi:putative ABC transport system ATP-binding protein
MVDRLVNAEMIGRTYGYGRGQVAALIEATFSIHAADRVALVGPSGSGKTTLLHLVAGLDRPTTGTISWPTLGEIHELRPGPVAIAFQGPSLLPPLTALENVALPAILGGAEEAAAEVEARGLLETFEAAALADKLPEELSGGQAQRVGLARAFIGSPRLVLADEPTGQQDRGSADRMMDALLSLAERSHTSLVIATHDALVAERLPTSWTIRDGLLGTEAMTCSA